MPQTYPNEGVELILALSVAVAITFGSYILFIEDTDTLSDKTPPETFTIMMAASASAKVFQHPNK